MPPVCCVVKRAVPCLNTCCIAAVCLAAGKPADGLPGCSRGTVIPCAAGCWPRAEPGGEERCAALRCALPCAGRSDGGGASRVCGLHHGCRCPDCQGGRLAGPGAHVPPRLASSLHCRASRFLPLTWTTSSPNESVFSAPAGRVRADAGPIAAPAVQFSFSIWRPAYRLA